VQLDPQEGQHHSPEEAEDAIFGLPKEYWLRLHRWATWKLTGNCMAEADEVIANVYERFCTGSRRWPIGVKIGTCFWNAVKSTISGEWTNISVACAAILADHAEGGGRSVRGGVRACWPG